MRARQPTPVLLPGEPWTEEPGGLQSMWSHRVGHDRGNLAHHTRDRLGLTGTSWFSNFHEHITSSRSLGTSSTSFLVSEVDSGGRDEAACSRPLRPSQNMNTCFSPVQASLLKIARAVSVSCNRTPLIHTVPHLSH